jgi:hypothetical protein
MATRDTLAGNCTTHLDASCIMLDGSTDREVGTILWSDDGKSGSGTVRLVGTPEVDAGSDVRPCDSTVFRWYSKR